MQHHCSSMQHKVEVAAKITINWRWQWWQRLEQWWWHGSSTAMQHHHSRLQCKMEVPAKKSRKQSTRVGGDGRQHAVGKYYNPAELSTSSVWILQLQQEEEKRKKKGCHKLVQLLPQCTKKSNCFFSVSVCSSNQMQCLLEQHYTEGSTWRAYEVTDIITLVGVVANDSKYSDHEHHVTSWIKIVPPLL